MEFLNVHLGPDTSERDSRFDSLISPNGSVAALEAVLKKSGTQSENILSLDDSFPGAVETWNFLFQHIEASKEKVYLLLPVLLYNAKRVVELAEALKQEFGNKVHIVVGGQLIPQAEGAYRNNLNIDTVSMGDAELLIPQMLSDINSGGLRSLYRGWMRDTQVRPKFSTFSYDRHWMIRERLQKQKEVAGFSQLTVQGPGGPGCSWAEQHKEACSFCALDNITTMNGISLEEHFSQLRLLQDTFAPDRFFDVANQFLPAFRSDKAKKWLEDYIIERDRQGVTVGSYGYFTVSSITDEVAGMMKQAGIEQVYLGVDHFHPEALKEEGKSWKKLDTLHRALNALQKQEITVRGSVVLGAAKETEYTLESVRNGLAQMLETYANPINGFPIIKSFGVLPIEILPGAPLVQKMRQQELCPDVFRFLDTHGFLTREQQQKLTESYISANSEVSYSEILQFKRECEVLFERFGIVNYDFDVSPDPVLGQRALKK